MRETWYVLEDGSAADPSDVAPDAGDALRHKDGRMVKMRGHVPSSRGVDPEEERAKARGADRKRQERTEQKPPSKKAMHAEDSKLSYMTRESKPE